MQYHELFALFGDRINYAGAGVDCGNGLVLRNFDFHSKVRFPAPSLETSVNTALPASVIEDMSGNEGVYSLINTTDAEIEENLHFRYQVMLPSSSGRARGIVLMLHGFNEKHWLKYLPWAAHIALNTGKAVVMFPIAFHMNRAPAAWSEARSMHRLSKERKGLYPDLIGNSLSNVAISTRLHNKPERFIWSGLESYHDLLDLIEIIKRGEHASIAPEASVDFFSYSIGTLLMEIAVMTNKNGYFSQSRCVAFCGGPVFNRLSPVSKFILDSEANVRLYSYLVEHLDSHMKSDSQLKRLLTAEEEGVNFRSLLNYRVKLDYREEKLRSLRDRFYAVALARDEVVPPYEVINTLQGSRKDMGIRVDVLDYPYPYRHEEPFPSGIYGRASLIGEIDRQFRRTFEPISAFLA
ncbi:MAG: DUF6051 family protein [Deltaproteobacteria bacterium]|jgi:hypothetical protein|nr:DUF6051 family protein [Deltaproteobacteria bacterium]